MSVNYYVYILTNINNEVLYVGITSNLIQRTYQHKNKLIKGFSEKYNIHKLVHFEVYSDIADALIREKRIKKWNRSWKNKLIEQSNPDWVDLYPTIL